MDLTRDESEESRTHFDGTRFLLTQNLIDPYEFDAFGFNFFFISLGTVDRTPPKSL